MGTTRDGKPVFYEPAKATNPHVCAVGSSGTGKTHLIRMLIKEYHARGITVVALDTQGDILGHGPSAVRGLINRVGLFYGGAGGASINPMRIAMDESHGGAVAAVEDVVDCFRVLKGTLGEMQEGELRRLIVGCYKNHGIDIEDPATWSKDCPNWGDLHRYARNVLLGSYDGRDPEPTPATAPGAGADEVQAPSEEHLKQCREREEWDAKRVRAISKTLRALLDTGLFSGDNIGIRRGQVNVIDVSKLKHKHRQMLIRVLLDRVLGYAIRSTPPEKMNTKLPHTVVILDEAKYAAAAGRGLFTPLNRIATEGRKYGLGMVVGVQRSEHLTEDQRLNCAVSFGLPVMPEARAGTAKYLGCMPAMLESIEPRAEAIYRFSDQVPKLIRVRSE